MKKTLTVNLNGRVYTIDEDAYRLLDNYLNNLRIYFRKEEGASEIIADFEARIEELFSEKIRLGHQVITFEHVEEVITRVGRPADFADREEKDEKQMPVTEPVKGRKKFYRNMDDKLLGGVCSGLAAYFDWSVVAIRVILILSPFILSSLKLVNLNVHLFLFTFNFGGLILLAYLIAWIVVPAAGTAEQKLQMHGKPITVENIGKTVSAQSAPVASKEPKGCLSGVVDLFVAFLKVCLAGLGCLVGLPLLFALIIVIIVIFAVLLGVGGGLIGIGGGLMGLLPSFIIVKHPVLLTVFGIFVIGIPVVALLYSIISYIAKWKPLSQPVKWTFLIIWIVSLILLITSGLKVDIDRHYYVNNREWPFSDDNRVIRGNNIPSQKIFDLEAPFDYLEIDKFLNANIYIEKTENEWSTIEISGDENLVNQVKYDQYNQRLILSTYNRLESKNNLKITIRTNDLQTIQSTFVGNIRMNRAFTGDKLDIVIKGVGNFQADSLYVNSLAIYSGGFGSVAISGKADKAHLETAGVGSVDAIDLLCDTIYAQVSGIGSVHCNPVEYLEGRVKGIGSIVYKEEPASKDVNSSGIGRIKRR